MHILCKEIKLQDLLKFNPCYNGKLYPEIQLRIVYFNPCSNGITLDLLWTYIFISFLVLMVILIQTVKFSPPVFCANFCMNNSPLLLLLPMKTISIGSSNCCTISHASSSLSGSPSLTNTILFGLSTLSLMYLSAPARFVEPFGSGILPSVYILLEKQIFLASW